MSSDSYSIVEEVMRSAGVPMSIWGPIMDIESKGNPQARNLSSIEDSVGLFALNRQGGLGQGYTVAQLQDARTNAEIASKAMAPAYQRGLGQGLSGIDLLRYTAYNSGWPTSAGVGMLSTNKTVQDYDRKLIAEYSYGEGGGGVYSQSAVIKDGLTSSVDGIMDSIKGMSSTQKSILLMVAGGVLLLGLSGD